MDLSKKLEVLHLRLTNSVLGSERPATLLLIGLLSKGHVLIEGAPGIGKTSLAYALSTGIGGDFKRVQFTPDLLPSDILGYHIYRQHSEDFDFIEGPVFSNLLLADEINRASPRVQSALLEAMNEGQVTIDGQTRKLEEPFIVVATQNALTSAGTFPLPEPQLDRFLLSVEMELPSREVQEQILLQNSRDDDEEDAMEKILSKEEIVQLQNQCLSVGVSETLCGYITRLCEYVRSQSGGQHTVSVRASLAILRASQAMALLQGESHVLPDHVKDVFSDVMRHRVLPEDASDVEMVIEQALRNTAVV